MVAYRQEGSPGQPASRIRRRIRGRSHDRFAPAGNRPASGPHAPTGKDGGDLPESGLKDLPLDNERRGKAHHLAVRLLR